ncbi:DUF4157 domain-containing protein [Agriterribacter sp.]|uniref:eCIS core domain-containing protein n=1 Tax=Agriterribacter sp. TaxID=2821509 RepID=UPI002CD348A5|nr:DUF4157 domain-containing protein [Agriterribacter sp.]HRO45273.1 DUF4157 domain-containing protein [Agriterribacter sp.]
MKTVESQTASVASVAKASQPFFSKNGTDNFFSKADTEQPSFFRASAGHAVKGNGILQTKLSIGQPNDKYEREADEMADKVVQRLANPSVQTKCAHCEEEEKKNAIQRKCTACEKEEELHAKAESSSIPAASPHIESSLNASRGSGNPLPANTKTQFEDSFGADFSNVRLHTDNKAAEMNKDLNAQAFTHGSNIYFNNGKYNPDSSGGKHLLAHELTHVVQQGGTAQKNLSTAKNGDGKISQSRNGSIQCQTNLTATRFSGNNILESVFDGTTVVSTQTHSRGTHVRLIQEALLALGYTLPLFGADGIFGNETKAAVRQFQVDNGAVLLDGIVGSETMRRLNMQDRGGTVAVAGPSPAPATAAVFAEEPAEAFTGYDNSVAPNWLVVPVNGRRHAQVTVAPAGAIPTYVSDTPAVATVQRTDTGAAVTGITRGTANITAREGATILGTLRVTVKNQLTRSVAFHYVCDSRAAAAGGPHCSNRTPDADTMRSLLNRVWHLQANILFTGGAAQNVVVAGDLGAAVDWTSALPGGGEWATVIATGAGANYNVFRVWRYMQDGTWPNDAANLGVNTLIGDNPCADGLGLAHECGHFLGLDHPSGFIMTPCQTRPGRRVSKAMVDIVNP